MLNNLRTRCMEDEDEEIDFVPLRVSRQAALQITIVPLLVPRKYLIVLDQEVVAVVSSLSELTAKLVTSVTQQYVEVDKLFQQTNITATLPQ